MKRGRRLLLFGQEAERPGGEGKHVTLGAGTDGCFGVAVVEENDPESGTVNVKTEKEAKEGQGQRLVLSVADTCKRVLLHPGNEEK